MPDIIKEQADMVNAQVVDSVNVINERVLGDVPAESHGVVLQSYGCAISLLMLNAVTTQNASAQIASASVVTACAEILTAGEAVRERTAARATESTSAPGGSGGRVS